ncbi:MAG: YbjN domain-containing protein [Gemmatimonadota bacterium]
MALTLDQLQGLLKAQEFKYFIHPDQPALMAGVTGNNGSFQIVLSLQENGEFLQLRTLQYLYCRPDDPHLDATLRVIGHLNFLIKLAKWGWDPSDGEINVCADVSVEDGSLTNAQFRRVLFNYLTAIDLNHPRLKQTLETGQDPGVMDPLINLPPELRAILERLAREAAGQEKEEGDFAEI